MTTWSRWPNDTHPDYPGLARESAAHWLEVHPTEDSGKWSWVARLIRGDGSRPAFANGTAGSREDAILAAERATEGPPRFTLFCLVQDGTSDPDRFVYRLVSQDYEGHEVAGTRTVELGEMRSIAAAQTLAGKELGLALEWEPGGPDGVSDLGDGRIVSTGCQ